MSETEAHEMLLEMIRGLREQLASVEQKLDKQTETVADLKATARWAGTLSGLASALLGHLGLQVFKG